MLQQREKPPLSVPQPRVKPQLPSMPQPRVKPPLSVPQPRVKPLLPLMPQPRVKPPLSPPQLPTPLLLPSMLQQRVRPPPSEQVFFVKHNKQRGMSIEIQHQKFREYSLYEIDNGYKCLSILYK